MKNIAHWIAACTGPIILVLIGFELARRVLG